MRLIFAGTPTFAACSLQALIAGGHTIVLVLTQPDRPAGRGMKLTPSPVKQLALEHVLPVLTPTSLKSAPIQAQLANYQADAMIVAAYGLILPQAVLALPRHGCLNIHASLLPRWRGAAPIQRAIQAGDAKTGICIMKMDAGLDTGAILACQAVPIAPDETSQTLHDTLMHLGAKLIVRTLAQLETLEVQPQPSEGITYAHKLHKEEAQIQWSQPAIEIERLIRAFNPAYTHYQGTLLKIWQAHVVKGTGVPGTALHAEGDKLVIACGQDALAIQMLQAAGGKKLTTQQFLRGHEWVAGQSFVGSQ